MSTVPIAAYSFLPWARQGLGIHIQEEDSPSNTKPRGSISVQLRVKGQLTAGGESIADVNKPVQLYGPGDIIGIDARAIIRTEPRHWITNFESNYLPFVEFYDEDFPWRYTPAKPSADRRRLRPWITLVILEENEFKEGGNLLGRKLPFIIVGGAAGKFPPPAELWAWAHVHVNGKLGGDPNDPDGLAQRLDQTIRADRDLAYSRLLCPRILKPNTGYHAFVIPTFESGRLAGLGADPAGVPSAIQAAWENYTGREGKEPDLYPYYHRWYFRTGSVGDFEYLVRLLKPKPVNPRVGTRDMDVQEPGANLPGIDDPVDGILRLGGALKVPESVFTEDELKEFKKYDEWAKNYPHPFQVKLASLVNLQTDYEEKAAQQANQESGLDLSKIEDGDQDPLIVPPIYGRWHAKTKRLLEGPAGIEPNRDNWVHELNLDPRFRVAAGFGTRVVQENQENLMESAWNQVGKVLEGNRKIRFGLMALATSRAWHARHFEAMQKKAPERFLMMAAPVERRVLAEGVTVYHQMQQSLAPAAAVSKTMRQAIRPRWRVARRAGLDAGRNLSNLLGRMNLGEVAAAPPKVVAPGLTTGEKLAEELRPRNLPASWLDALRRRPWLRWLPLIVALVLALIALLLFPLASGLALAVASIAAGALIYRRIDRIRQRDRAADVLRPDLRTPEAVDDLPASPDFRIRPPGTGSAPQIGTTDSQEAKRFKASLRNLYQVDATERDIPLPSPRKLNLAALATATVETIRPDRTIPARILGSVQIPERIRRELVEDFGEVMVYPEFDQPMYGPLKEISAELFLPNIQLIEENSITLLETNQKFIESYLVGLNHEFARELLWREYPTDQRGSYFRQFWDVTGFLADPNIDRQTLREKLRDIPELHRWPKDSKLGQHDNREERPGVDEDELVLVIRGELLKKYPTAVVYAHRAAWQRTNDHKIDKSKPRLLLDLPAGQESNPPRDIVKTPLYEAKVDPDIYFFGFDLTEEVARGGKTLPNGEEDPGWFFVIQERPGEPRFGLDLPRDAPQSIWHTWNDLAWSDVVATLPVAPGTHLKVGQKPVSLTDPGNAQGTDVKTQYDEDKRFRWRTDTHAAELAYILYQVPVMMAVHAAEMLPRLIKDA